MAAEVVPLSEACGAEICNVDVTKPLSNDDVSVITSAFNNHKVLLFRQQPMSAEQLRDFSAHFGALQEHVQRKYQHPDVPEVVCMTNRKPDGSFDEVGASRGAAADIRDGWHSDLSFEKVPAKATLLHAVEIPSSGGNTCFSNTTKAYEALNFAMKQRLNGLRAEYLYGQAKRNKMAAKAAEGLQGKDKTETAAIHPVIVKHAETGQPGIYVSPFTTSRILDLPEVESEELIEALVNQMTNDAFRWEHIWSVGDTLMWDNRGGLMHAGRLDYPRDEARLFIRTTVRGGPLASYEWAGDC
ncbi:MAG: TauD/TfdA dioxygenase family protein [Hyphomicrobiaceae bacterium]